MDELDSCLRLIFKFWIEEVDPLFNYAFYYWLLVVELIVLAFFEICFAAFDPSSFYRTFLTSAF